MTHNQFLVSLWIIFLLSCAVSSVNLYLILKKVKCKVRVIVSKESGFSIARHEGVVIYAGFEDTRTIQEAMNYVELYQSKWYRRLKRWILSLFRKYDDVAVGTGVWNITGTMNLKCSLTGADNCHFQGEGNFTIIDLVEKRGE